MLIRLENLKLLIGLHGGEDYTMYILRFIFLFLFYFAVYQVVALLGSIDSITGFQHQADLTREYL